MHGPSLLQRPAVTELVHRLVVKHSDRRRQHGVLVDGPPVERGEELAALEEGDFHLNFLGLHPDVRHAPAIHGFQGEDPCGALLAP
eukprot:11168154-Lingulodinium_polyedra.AAC.1